MGYDLRDFVAALKRAGELVEVNDEVDWNYEIPAYEVISGRYDGPAFLFNKIKGIPEGPRVAVGLFSGSFKKPHRRCAIAFGMEPSMDRVTWTRELVEKAGNLLRPVEVATGPCKEVVKMGKEINLLEFPFTYHAIGDGGRYIFTDSTIIRDPDSDWLNTGLYCIEVFSRNRLVITPYAHTNFVNIYTKYEQRGQSMPFAVCLGGDPVVTMASGMILPPGVSEYDMAGGLRGTPVELVRAETSDLLIPADAEIVIEGEIRPYERLPEGPKVEVFGFSVGPRQPFYAMRVHCITHRKNPILFDLHTAPGGGGNSLQDAFGPLGSLSQIKVFGFPQLKLASSVNPTRTGATVSSAVIKHKYPEDYPGYMRDLFDRFLGQPGMGGVFACNFFADDDVNILDYGQFFEAMFTQTNPARDIIKSPGKYPTMTIESSWMEAEDRAGFSGPGTILSHKLIIDATTKEEPPMGVRRLAFETMFPSELQEWVVENWAKLGFAEEPVWNKSWLEAKF